MRIKKELILPKDIINISNLYRHSGKELYVVGGAVRDSILGQRPKDYDLATNATPEESIGILNNHYQVLEIGKAFGIISAVTSDFPKGVEIAAFREDLSSGRQPDVKIGCSIETDVKRRDLTINALFYDIHTKEIVDLVGGLEDIKNQIIRTVGDPDERFKEDPLRRLRAIRFSQKMGYFLEAGLYESLAKDNDLSTISRERIKDEFYKILTTSKVLFKSLELLNSLGMMNYLFPNLRVNLDLSSPLEPLVSVALMLRKNVDPLEKYPFRRLQTQLNQCKWMDAEINAITLLIKLLDLDIDTAYQLKKQQLRSKVTDSEVFEFLSIIGKDSKLIQSFMDYKITVNPEELMKQGFQGEALGKEILRLETNIFKGLLHVV